MALREVVSWTQDLTHLPRALKAGPTPRVHPCSQQPRWRQPMSTSTVNGWMNQNRPVQPCSGVLPGGTQAHCRCHSLGEPQVMMLNDKSQTKTKTEGGGSG